MENTTVHNLMKRILVGKNLKYCKSSKAIIQNTTIRIKKSNSVTEKQIKENFKRFTMLSNKSKVIGTHKIFEISKIIDITISYGDWEGANMLVIVLENGHSQELEVDTVIQEVDNNTIMFKY